MRKNYLRFGLITTLVGLTLIFLPPLFSLGQGTSASDNTGHDWMESIRANQYSGVVNPDDVLQARLESEMMQNRSASGAINLNWINAGPDNYSGLVWSAIFDKSDASARTIIAGTEGGGIWKSTNLGLTWNPMPVENNEVLKVSSLIQTSSGTIYAATGITSCKSVNYNGSGIYKSEGGGQFTLIPSTRNNPDFLGIAKLALNTTSGRIYAATSGGLYYSDNGNDWVKSKTGYTMDVCVGPDGTVLTAVADSAYLSVGGTLDNWVTLTTGKPNMLPKSGYGWMVFAIAPSDPNIMYASFSNIAPDSRMQGVYSSRDKGATWSVIFPSNPVYEPFAGAGCYSNTLAVFPNDPDKVYLGGRNMWLGRKIQPTGFYNWEQVSFGFYSPWVTFSAPEYHHSYMFRPGYPNQLAMATDGGVAVATEKNDVIEFQTSTRTFGSSQFFTVAFSSDKRFVMGGGRNVGSLAMGYFYPSFTSSVKAGWPLSLPTGLIQGSNGGSGVWSNLNPNIGVFTVRTASVSNYQRQDFRDLTYENDFMNGITSVYPTSYSPMHLWESFNFNQSKDSVWFHSRSNYYRADTTIQVESANGITFPYTTLEPLFPNDSIYLLDPIASRFFVYANRATTNYGYGIHMTKDMLKFYKGAEYFVVMKDTANKVDLVSAFTVSSDLNTLWAGTAKGRLIRVTGLINAQDSITANEFSEGCVLTKDVYTNTPFTGRKVTSISIDPANSNRVLVTLGNYGNNDYVYFSSNAGSAEPVFNSIQSNLPKAPVFSGLIELHGNNAIVGTDMGLYSTTDLGAVAPQWGPDMNGIGNVAVTDIRQQTMKDYHIENYGAVYMSTYGLGIWMDTTFLTPVGMDDANYRKPSTGEPLIINPNPASDRVTVTGHMPAAGTLALQVYDLTGRIVATFDKGYHQKGDYSVEVSVSALPSGSYIIKAGTSAAKLIRK